MTYSFKECRAVGTALREQPMTDSFNQKLYRESTQSPTVATSIARREQTVIQIIIMSHHENNRRLTT